MKDSIHNDQAYRSQRDLDLSSLTVLYGLSIRTFNVCKSAQLDHLSTIREFRERHGGFSKLRNCGVKTVTELEELLAKSDPNSPTAILYKEELLTADQIQRIYMQHFIQLDREPREALTAFTGPPLARIGIDFFMRHGESLKGVETISEKVRKELRGMRRTLFQTLDRQRHALRVEKLKSSAFTLEEWFQFHGLSERARTYLFARNGRMTLLRFMDHYLEHFDNHNAYQLLIFRIHKAGSKYTANELGDRFDLTAERVRQILISAEGRLRKPFEVIADLPSVQEHYPELFTTGPLLMVTDELVDGLNARDGTEFAAGAVLHIAHAVDPYGLIMGSWTTLMGYDKRSMALNSERLFLIDPLIVEPVQRGITELRAFLKKKRKQPEGIGSEDLLKDVSPLLHARSLFALKELVAIRFPELVLEGEQFIVPANKMKFNDDRLKEVLERLNEPSHVSMVLAEWSRSFPEHSMTAQAISNMVVHNKDVFMSLGWTSTYALRCWEKDRPEMNKGSIRTIVAKLLDVAATPLHREDLEEAIKRDRPRITGLGIMHNLRLDNSGTFRFFPGGHVGLVDKAYDHIPATPANVPGHLLRYAILARFIGKERTELAAYLKSECEASPKRIERVIHKSITDGRLVVDAEGIILSVHRRPGESQ